MTEVVEKIATDLYSLAPVAGGRRQTQSFEIYSARVAAFSGEECFRGMMQIWQGHVSSSLAIWGGGHRSSEKEKGGSGEETDRGWVTGDRGWWVWGRERRRMREWVWRRLGTQLEFMNFSSN